MASWQNCGSAFRNLWRQPDESLAPCQLAWQEPEFGQLAGQSQKVFGPLPARLAGARVWTASRAKQKQVFGPLPARLAGARVWTASRANAHHPPIFFLPFRRRRQRNGRKKGCRGVAFLSGQTWLPARRAGRGARREEPVACAMPLIQRHALHPAPCSSSSAMLFIQRHALHPAPCM
jgi:hypothetical protein